jgi:hypothetical protein
MDGNYYVYMDDEDGILEKLEWPVEKEMWVRELMKW